KRNISGCSCSNGSVQSGSDIESLASQTSSAALQLRFAQNDRKQPFLFSFRDVFRLRRECFQERRARKWKSPEQIPKRKGRICFQSCLIVHTGDTRQLGLEVRDGARCRIICVEITKTPAQQVE